jgi:hypothetical protein
VPLREPRRAGEVGLATQRERVAEHGEYVRGRVSVEQS